MSPSDRMTTETIELAVNIDEGETVFLVAVMSQNGAVANARKLLPNETAIFALSPTILIPYSDRAVMVRYRDKVAK